MRAPVSGAWGGRAQRLVGVASGSQQALWLGVGAGSREARTRAAGRGSPSGVGPLARRIRTGDNGRAQRAAGSLEPGRCHPVSLVSC